MNTHGGTGDDAAASDRVGIVGLGRLGLCQALTLERAGYDVLGCDVFPAYVDSINNKTLQSDEPFTVRTKDGSVLASDTLHASIEKGWPACIFVEASGLRLE